MKKRKRSIDLLSIMLGICIIISALIGIFYSNSGKSFEVVNMYGDTVKIYGDGIYAYNSVFNVSNYLGSNASGIIAATLLILLSLWKSRPLWADILRTSEIVNLLYASACSVFGISMNQLYFLYVLCFGLAIFASYLAVNDLFAMIEVPQALKEKKLMGTAIFLMFSGTLTALVWLTSLLPAVESGNFGTLLGIQTNEVTYGLDLSIVCPLCILCGIWLIKKKDIGYKVAPLLLNMLVGVAIMVVIQRAYCLKLGIELPIQVLISFVISFVLLGLIALFFLVKLVTNLKRANV